MKTKPDDITLTRWMDGELEGEELCQMESWAREHPELLAERDAVQALSADLREHVASSEEPPYPEFFNQKILRAIEEEQAVSSPTTVEATAEEKGMRGFWQWLTAPVAIPMAMAAMALCFYLGTQMGSEPKFITDSTVAAVKEATVYTPDGEVSANIYNSDKATVIVLEGLEDMPDDLEMAGSPSTNRPGAVMVNTENSEYIY